MNDPSLPGFVNSAQHLLAELQRLELLLRREVLRLRAANLIVEDPLRGLYIPDAQVEAMFDAWREPDDSKRDDAALNSVQALRTRAEQLRVSNAQRARAGLAAGVDLPLARLERLFGLTPFEVDVILIAAAPELDRGYETLYAYVQNDVTQKRPGVDLALKLLCTTFEERLAQRAVFDANGVLVRERLIRLMDYPDDREPALPARFIKIDSRLVDWLLGRDAIDARLSPFTRRIVPSTQLSDLAAPETLQAQLAHAIEYLADGGAAFFSGPYGVGKQAAAEAICAARGCSLLVADVRLALAGDAPFAETLALLRREALLQGAGLYLNHCETLLDDEEPSSRAHRLTLARELARPGLLVCLGSTTAWQIDDVWRAAHWLKFEFALPDFSLRLQTWNEAFQIDRRCLAGDVDLAAVANKFVLSAGQIRDAVREAERIVAVRSRDQRHISLNDVHAAARAQSNAGLSRLAQKIEPVYGWSDLVLPPRPMRQLRAVCASVQYRHIVYTRWGFNGRSAMGKGVNVLFSGASGTGKTMAAQILASELKLDLYRIDLSSVVSKYIGETEKNLSRIFREAQASNAILFFDEADALFGKRSEVKDAHDRYANIEVAYLLQKMEEYEGVVILATNLSKNLDDAFARRMQHTIEFPFPDATYRERIWRGVFPSGAPLAETIDFGFLARQFELAGGNIRNVAVAAAFMAAEANGAIGMDHLILATAREFQKMGRLPAQSDFRHYYELVREQG